MVKKFVCVPARTTYSEDPDIARDRNMSLKSAPPDFGELNASHITTADHSFPRNSVRKSRASLHLSNPQPLAYSTQQFR
jgi:hypothetical protein